MCVVNNSYFDDPLGESHKGTVLLSLCIVKVIYVRIDNLRMRNFWKYLTTQFFGSIKGVGMEVNDTPEWYGLLSASTSRHDAVSHKKLIRRRERFSLYRSAFAWTS